MEMRHHLEKLCDPSEFDCENPASREIFLMADYPCKLLQVQRVKQHPLQEPKEIPILYMSRSAILQNTLLL